MRKVRLSVLRTHSRFLVLIFAYLLNTVVLGGKGDKKIGSELLSRKEEEIAESVTTKLSGNMKSSLLMEERTEFLITPALVLREVMLDGVVPIYP